MEMLFWVADAVAQKKFDIKYFPGKEILADYQSKHHTGTHHILVHPWYLHKPMSGHKLPHACKLSTLKRCVGNLPDGYVRTKYRYFSIQHVWQMRNIWKGLGDKMEDWVKCLHQTGIHLQQQFCTVQNPLVWCMHEKSQILATCTLM
jgi:hypothetical protein